MGVGCIWRQAYRVDNELQGVVQVSESRDCCFWLSNYMPDHYTARRCVYELQHLIDLHMKKLQDMEQKLQAIKRASEQRVQDIDAQERRQAMLEYNRKRKWDEAEVIE
jgi:hypothetical protein